VLPPVTEVKASLSPIDYPSVVVRWKSSLLNPLWDTVRVTCTPECLPVVVTSKQTAAKVTDLLPGEKYVFRVTALSNSKMIALVESQPLIVGKKSLHKTLTTIP